MRWAPWAGLCASLLPAYAQTSGGSEDTAAQKVTVTAPAGRGLVVKSIDAGVLGELPLLETPFSVNVIPRTLLEKQQAANYGDFLKNDPSANFGNVPVGFTSLRGFAVGTAGYLFDGLPGNAGLSDGRGQIEAIERIDILKGPSAFLYGLGGSTSLGGTLNYLPKRPISVPVRTLSAGYTSRSLFSLLGDLGDRFGEERQFGYRLNMGVRDGEQAVAGADWRHGAVSLALDWQATPDVSLTTIIDTADNRFPQLQPFFALAPGIAVPEAPDASPNIAQPWDDFHTRYSNAYLRADWAFAPQWTASAQLLYNRGERLQTKEARFGSIDDADGNVSQFSSEGGGSSTNSSAQVLVHGRLSTGPVDHQLTLGASGGIEESDYSSAFLGVFATNLYRPVAAPEPAGAAPVPGPKQKVRSSSLLASDIVGFGPQWSLLIGARSGRLGIDSSDGSTGQTLSSRVVTRTVPTAAVLFKPTPGALLYLNYGQGIEPGGQAPAGTTNENQYLGPIVTDQYELGGRIDLNGLMLAAALFDLQRPLEYVDPQSGAYVQNGDQRHRGFEFTAAGQLTADWSVFGGLMWLDPSVSSTGNPATDGNQPVGVSRFNGNLFIEYRVEAVPGLYLNGGAYYRGPQYVDLANTQQIAGATRFDLGARYETRIGITPAAFLIGVENVADKSYWADAQNGVLTLAEPLTVKATARFAF